MRFARLYRASMYAMLTVSTLLLNIDANVDNRFAMLYPVAVAVAAAVAFLSVDRDPRRGLPRDLANFLALIATGLMLAEWYNDSNVLVLALGHWVVYLQIIWFFLQKKDEDDWYLFGMGLLQVVIGVFISQSDEVGVLLFAWALLALWSFGLFHLQRESAVAPRGRGVQVAPAPNPDEPYPGFLNLGFVLSTLRVAAATLALGLLIFLLLPRFPSRGGRRPGQAPGQHLTGFSNSVRLGQMGEILENDSVVLSAELLDANDPDRGAIRPPTAEPLWRGLTLSSYSRGQWTRERPNSMKIGDQRLPRPRGNRQLRQRVKMQPADNDTLFALAPVLNVWGGAGDIVVNRDDGSIYRRDLRPDAGDVPPSRPGPFDYDVVSDWFDGDAPPIRTYYGERPPESVSLDTLRSLSPDLDEALAEIVEPIVKPLLEHPPEDPQQARIALARALERYLNGPEFGYTLRMEVVDPTLDPVLDFLRNRKAGHCEYFASALALMCRSAGLPSRLVNGFKGGDWNELGRVLVVRQKHAHSWVEVYLGLDRRDQPQWLTLDPTPGEPRDLVVARVGTAMSRRFRPLSDFLREQWTRRVAGLDRERQDREIYGPIRKLIEDAGQGFRIMGQMLRDLASWFYFEDPGQFFSGRGFVVAVLSMLALAGAAWLARRAVWRLTGRGGGGRLARDAEDPGVAFYHRLVRALAEVGLDRSDRRDTPRVRRPRRAGAGRSRRGVGRVERSPRPGGRGVLRQAVRPSAPVGRGPRRAGGPARRPASRDHRKPPRLSRRFPAGGPPRPPRRGDPGLERPPARPGPLGPPSGRRRRLAGGLGGVNLDRGRRFGPCRSANFGGVQHDRRQTHHGHAQQAAHAPLARS